MLPSVSFVPSQSGSLPDGGFQGDAAHLDPDIHGYGLDPGHRWAAKDE
jgi:hypothetical protein